MSWQFTSTAFLGLNTPILSVEADIRAGLPQIQLVGLSEARGKAIRERVRAALLNSGFTVPHRRITITFILLTCQPITLATTCQSHLRYWLLVTNYQNLSMIQ